MPVFFVPSEQIHHDGSVHLKDRDAHHLARVLRGQPGEVITVIADAGLELQVRLESVSPDGVVGVVIDQRATVRESSARLHLVQVIPKGGGMDEICERSSELGVYSIWPVTSERAVPRLDQDRASARAKRWQQIAGEAAQLAGRHLVPTVQPLRPLEQSLATLQADNPRLQLFACHGGEVRRALSTEPWDPSLPTAVIVGPEGGFSEEEVARLAQMTALPVSLGPRTLRSTLAGVVALTILLNRAGELAPHGLASGVNSAS